MTLSEKIRSIGFSDHGAEYVAGVMHGIEAAAQLVEAYEVERLRDANLQRVAEGMSRWCNPQSPHIDAIAAALEHAKAKHPHFADVAVSSLDNKTAADGLADFREFLNMVIGRGLSTGVDVLKCELWEAVEAFTRKDYAATMDELAQCGAVVIRMMEAVQALVDEAAKAGKEEQ